MGKYSAQEQADWVYTKDVVITPHGQQGANLAFIRKCTAVLELSPKGFLSSSYFLEIPNSLIGVVYGSYPGSDPVEESREARKGGNLRMKRRDVTYLNHTKPETIVEDLAYILDGRQQCCKRYDMNDCPVT
mmetsp:Transcript_20656/g.45082  ORF Transcript_20656/g.45082 Transcript_20656/m.45082 type:complete len:131 (-) Transcript_20656:1156-1548(-)